MKEICVIGAGTMGNGIAHCFAQNKLNVILIDSSIENLEKAKENINTNLDRMIKKGIISTNEKINTLNRISFKNSLDNAIKNVDLVIEAVTESIQIKREIFSKVDKICNSETIFATNTSSISIKEISKSTSRSEKFIGMHFMNPVPLMKLVEVIQSPLTNKNTTNQIIELSKQLNKIPVLVNDAPGFVANRILLPMINESILTLEEEVSGVKEIDTVMILGMSHPMGPLQLADFIGLDVCLSILEVLYTGFQNAKYKPSNLLIEMVKNGELGVKTKKGFYNYNNGIKNKTVAERFN
ncbi:MAG: 3-hydroxybutyryl-CoA dehydrogenase [Flavobacteriales bacterium]|nr:3-hydroxybutyryl-CoA dehydrogenase [Flavobacteriales bacterium]